MTKELLLIFTRNPELGKVKTRLAASIGNDAALRIYKMLIQHTVLITQDLPVDKKVYYSEKVVTKDYWDNKIYTKEEQIGNDLGVRMKHAFNTGFIAGYEKVIIIGSDMYDLGPTDLMKAFDSLSNHDYVLGPAEDGGFYLLGMKKMNDDIFSNKEWGNDTVLPNTLKDLEDDSVFLLEIKNDIDRIEDLGDNSIFQEFLGDSSRIA